MRLLPYSEVVELGAKATCFCWKCKEPKRPGPNGPRLQATALPPDVRRLALPRRLVASTDWAMPLVRARPFMDQTGLSQSSAGGGEARTRGVARTEGEGGPARQSHASHRAAKPLRSGPLTAMQY